MQEPVFIMIMDSLIGPECRRIERLYDLKGSSLKRFTQLTEDEKENGSGLKCLKDQNFDGILVGDIEKEELLQQLERDSKFLSALSLIDYSMLLTKVKNLQDGQIEEEENCEAL